MGRFFSELKRRNVFRVAIAYLVVAWLILQLVSVISPMVILPAWFSGFVLVLLIVGFPVACIFAWAFELTPEGLKRTVEVKPEQSIAVQTASKLDRVIIAVLTLAVAVLLFDRFYITTPSAPPVTVDTPAVDIALAVLPFADLSPERDQEHFSDGISEEIINVLVKVRGLRVMGRTSAFQFKGENRDLRSIGEALNASHIIEGSVRKSGDRIRITAQLIKAEDGFHLWSETYDRELDLSNVFGIQEDIARAVADALQVPLGFDAGIAFAAAPAVDFDVYEDFLRTRALARQQQWIAAVEAAEALTLRAPDFAPGWALLSQLQTAPDVLNRPRTGPDGTDIDELQTIKRSLTIARDAAARAAALDPDNVYVLTAVAISQESFATFAEVEDTYRKALGIDSTNPDVLDQYARFLRLVGKNRAALNVYERLLAFEPTVPLYQGPHANLMYITGDVDGALAYWKAMPSIPTAITVPRLTS